MKAEVKNHNGTPTLFLDGVPTYANFHLLSPFDGDYRAANLPYARKFGELGIDLYSIDACGPEWPGPRPGQASHFDFATVGPRLQAILDQNPRAHFLLRMGFETRYLLNNWWNTAYPDELEVVGEEGESTDDVAIALKNGDGPPRRISQSTASTVWHEHVKELLRGYIAHLREIGLYDRVIAYQIAAGACGEWVKGDSDQGKRFGDFSEPMRRNFRAWLRHKYANDVAALRAAWDAPTLSFEAAEVPSPQAQHTTQHGVFRDPQREAQVIDYYACLAELTAGVVTDFCKTVKDATQGEKLTGAFFGYLMDLSWNINFFGPLEGGVDYATIQRCGHLGLSQLLRSSQVDFLVSPYGYAFRGIGGDGLAMQPSESVRLHGKLYLMEEDTLMHNRFEPDGRMHAIQDTLAIYKRNFANCLVHGHGMTWLQSSVYAEYPEIEAQADALHKHMGALGQWALQLNRKPQAEIAVLLDDETYFYTTLQNTISLPGVFYQRVFNLPRIGAPHDVYLLRDLVEGKLPPYKLYIFLNAFRLTRAQREALAQQLRRDGRTALWLYAPGYICDDARPPASPLHEDHMTELTGLRFGRADNPWSVHLHVTNVQHEITRDIPQDLFWGTQRSLAPIFHVADPDATVLGQMITVYGRSKPGLALKEFPAWNSIYCATPNIPAPLLRGIARYASVHLYSQAGDVLCATPELLSVHTTGGGPRTFSLPRRAEVVYDLFERREVARDAYAFNVVLAPASTALFYTGDDAMLERHTATWSR